MGHYFDNLTVFFFLFCVLLKSMGGTIPPAPASTSTDETSKVRYKEFCNCKITFVESKCYWVWREKQKLPSNFTQIVWVNTLGWIILTVQSEACPLGVIDSDLLQMAFQFVSIVTMLHFLHPECLMFSAMQMANTRVSIFLMFSWSVYRPFLLSLVAQIIISAWQEVLQAQ